MDRAQATVLAERALEEARLERQARAEEQRLERELRAAELRASREDATAEREHPLAVAASCRQQ